MNWFARKRTYLDWAASAPVAPVARRAFAQALAVFGNPSSPHEEGERAKRALEDARAAIARLAEVKPEGVVFTSGASEANNLALMGPITALKEQKDAERGMHILYLPSAHASVIETLKALSLLGVEIEPLVVTDGRVDTARLKEQLRFETRLVSVDAVCAETGTQWNTRSVRTVLDEYAREHGTPHVLLHVDASQMPLTAPFALTRLAADLVTLDAQKVGGIRGVGALCMRSRVRLSRLMHGGGQERGIRPGTEPVALAVAFAAALAEAAEGRERFERRARFARAELIANLCSELPNLHINAGKNVVPHILNLSFPGRDTDYLVMLLDRDGFAISTKSACERHSEAGSRAVMLLTCDEPRARATLRVSWGPSTSRRELRRFVTALVRNIRFMDAHSV